MDMSQVTICFEGIQRIYRNAVVSFLRTRFEEAFSGEAEEKLKRPFAKEWANIEQNASAPRKSGELLCSIRDSFDLLGINHFYNLFECYYDDLFPEGKGDDEHRKESKQSLLRWTKEIKNLRDPLSHPVEADFDNYDALRILDSARRVLVNIGCQKESKRVELLMDDIGQGSQSEAYASSRGLEDRLPPQESVVPLFIGREKELDTLWAWFHNPHSGKWLLAGDGGKGKTALAYDFAVRVKNAAPDGYAIVLWMSAKRKKFVEGQAVHIAEPDFSDLNSALSQILTQYGWGEKADGTLESKETQALELLNEFPALVVVDDIDSVAQENEDVIEFFSDPVSKTKSKVLFTSRRTPFGMGSVATQISGFDNDDARHFVVSRYVLMGLDQSTITNSAIEQLRGATEGSPLYMEDLLRLTASLGSLPNAIKEWKARGGDEARKYALGREFEMLTEDAKKCLIAACLGSGGMSFEEIVAITGFPQGTVSGSMTELQKLFLVPKAKLMEGEERFRVNVNTRILVKEVCGSFPMHRKLETAYKNLTKEISNSTRDTLGQIIRKALILSRESQQEEAERILLSAFEQHQHPDLKGVLGLVYSKWNPTPRMVEARECFVRAWQLKGANEDMYVHWCRMEESVEDWGKLVDAAHKGFQMIPRSRVLLQFKGYGETRWGKDLASEFTPGKAEEAYKRARKDYEQAINIPKSYHNDDREKYVTSKIFRGLVLVCELLQDRDGLYKYFSKWKEMLPSDSLRESEWERISYRWQLRDGD